MTPDELQKILQERQIELHEFFSEVLAESRDLDKTYRDFVAKVLSFKVKNGQVSAEKAQELLFEIIKYNQRMEKLMCDLNSAPAELTDLPPGQPTLPPCAYGLCPNATIVVISINVTRRSPF